MIRFDPPIRVLLILWAAFTVFYLAAMAAVSHLG